MKSVLQQLKECPNDILALRKLEPKVNDHLDAILSLFKLGIVNKEQTEKCIKDIEVICNEIKLTLLN